MRRDGWCRAKSRTLWRENRKMIYRIYQRRIRRRIVGLQALDLFDVSCVTDDDSIFLKLIELASHWECWIIWFLYNENCFSLLSNHACFRFVNLFGSWYSSVPKNARKLFWHAIVGDLCARRSYVADYENHRWITCIDSPGQTHLLYLVARRPSHFRPSVSQLPVRGKLLRWPPKLVQLIKKMMPPNRLLEYQLEHEQKLHRYTSKTFYPLKISPGI